MAKVTAIGGFFWSRRTKHLKTIKMLHPELPANVIPFGLPILCESREYVRDLLRSHEVYAPVHRLSSADRHD